MDSHLFNQFCIFDLHERLKHLLHPLDTLHYFLLKEVQIAGKFYTCLELLEVTIVVLKGVVAGEYSQAHLKDISIGRALDIHDLVLLEVTPGLHVAHVMQLHVLQGLHYAAGVV